MRSFQNFASKSSNWVSSMCLKASFVLFLRRSAAEKIMKCSGEAFYIKLNNETLV